METCVDCEESRMLSRKVCVLFSMCWGPLKVWAGEWCDKSYKRKRWCQPHVQWPGGRRDSDCKWWFKKPCSNLREEWQESELGCILWEKIREVEYGWHYTGQVSRISVLVECKLLEGRAETPSVVFTAVIPALGTQWVHTKYLSTSEYESWDVGG